MSDVDHFLIKRVSRNEIITPLGTLELKIVMKNNRISHISFHTYANLDKFE